MTDKRTDPSPGVGPALAALQQEWIDRADAHLEGPYHEDCEDGKCWAIPLQDCADDLTPLIARAETDDRERVYLRGEWETAQQIVMDILALCPDHGELSPVGRVRDALAASEARVQALEDDAANVCMERDMAEVGFQDLAEKLQASEAARQQMQQKVEELLTIKVVDYSDDIGERLTLVEQALTALVVAWDNSSDEQLEHALAFARSIIDRERGI